MRFLNEFTADKVDRHGGFKMGDYGMGGRSYTKYTVGSSGRRSGSSSSGGCLLFGIFMAVLSSFGVYYTERSRNLDLKAATAAVEAVDAPLPLTSNTGRLVFVSAALSLVGAPAQDSFFQYKFSPLFAAGRRVTEYCQWMEVRNENRREVGRTAKYRCGDSVCGGDPIYETTISFVSPARARRVPQDAPHKTYPRSRTPYPQQSYYKGWRSGRVNSLLFDNPVAYHNPSRDPAPSDVFSPPSGTLALGGSAANSAGFTVGIADAEDALSAWAPIPIAKRHVTGLGYAALRAGFSEADHLHFYSRVPSDGLDNPALKSAAAYLVDGVVDVESAATASGVEAALARAGLDWITKGTCHAGDIRVRFEGRALPREGASLVADQVAGGKLVGHVFSEGAERRVLALPGLMTKASFIKQFLSNSSWSAMWRRFAYVAGFALALWGFSEASAEAAMKKAA